MFAIVVALIILAVAVGAIYLILKDMGEAGIEVAAPGSCKSGSCGVRCAPVTEVNGEQVETLAEHVEESQRKEAA
jgi:hypothetical protein